MPEPDRMKGGSRLLSINGRGVMRVGDQTAHGGKITMCVPMPRADQGRDHAQVAGRGVSQASGSRRPCAIRSEPDGLSGIG